MAWAAAVEGFVVLEAVERVGGGCVTVSTFFFWFVILSLVFFWWCSLVFFLAKYSRWFCFPMKLGRLAIRNYVVIVVAQFSFQRCWKGLSLFFCVTSFFSVACF